VVVVQATCRAGQRQVGSMGLHRIEYSRVVAYLLGHGGG